MKFCAPALITALALSVSLAQAEPCANNSYAIGTERILEVDAKATPRVGKKHFPVTLPLQKKEVVLTFDDGPWPETTPKVLEALKAECVRATFFILGRHAEAYPGLARRILAEGHSVGHHTYSHQILSRVPVSVAEQEIDKGIEEDDYAIYGQRRSEPVTPFFRFPGFASTPALLGNLERRGIVVFGADVWASDWNPMTAEQEMRLTLDRLEQTKGGILLFHDTKAQTAAMLPPFLRELKRRQYRIVHIVPAGSRGALRVDGGKSLPEAAADARAQAR
ncbi:MAG: polysaccharide deacetylase family protein [Pseudolabrys sp.]|nr:polysaccharide deacetylase family protein [Pseudolabrys sp.]MBV9955557.1 polysaccharide deacetylase family protein [Pseudolabrys sp.]